MERLFKRTLWLVCLAVFLLGALVGGLGTGAYITANLPPPPPPPEVLTKLVTKRVTSNLDLTDDQAATVMPIVFDTIKAVIRMHAQLRDRESAMEEEALERVRPHLRPEQMVKLQEGLARMRAHRDRMLDWAHSRGDFAPDAPR